MCEDEEPEEKDVADGAEFYFVFLVDRSGSMGGDRIEKAKEALALFVRSLPIGCRFTVISFGSRYS